MELTAAWIGSFPARPHSHPAFAITETSRKISFRQTSCRKSRASLSRRWTMRRKSAVLTVGRSLPVFPDQRTFSGEVGMSQTCTTAEVKEQPSRWPLRIDFVVAWWRPRAARERTPCDTGAGTSVKSYRHGEAANSAIASLARCSLQPERRTQPRRI